MSVAELKQAVDELTTDQRLELAEYLRWRSRKDDPEWQAELARALAFGTDHFCVELCIAAVHKAHHVEEAGFRK